MHTKHVWFTGVLLLVSAAHAEPVDIVVTGEVEFNQITDPPLGNANPGDAVTMTFTVDSEVFIDSASFPTRGYAIDGSSFVLTLGSATIGLQDPFPSGQTPYFVLRDDDPAVDGFFISTDVDGPIGIPLDQVGIFGNFRDNFSVTYTGGVLSSLDILGALGTYDFDQLTVFNWTIDDGAFMPLGMLFSEMTITAGLLFSDGFESGDTAAWSQTQP